MAAGEQLALPFKGSPRLREPRLGGRQSCLGGPQSIDLVLRIELGEILTGVHMLADIHQPLDHTAADAKAE